mmetsp:Transcript_12561/g.26219  ORF Transcript_12561/g.26219 Transcript_12561/m.26219 type:complete len:258 (+) Transcript_12561:64-837(+)|eukprot:CAMPEP_0201148818 /NCGR_PEP_ID=MMETSP0851-20130426/10232_1 /ASSEMBLY_ACC=CAM_ASM_000631 /TAXON_ID=183588 /ORGANISM="Pseudo-nitzschia fraudulenta, Strain WWA7" /LENGTH=257 /DNA_ID=CAMNT_0047425079 /DNA_START=57 /DNA_END=830 /DNA_ORIENTATION=+
MISLTKVTLFVLYSSMLAAVVSGRTSINTNGGGSGGGSDGRTKAQGVSNSPTRNNNNKFTSTFNSGSSSSSTSSGGSSSSSSSGSSNFGTTGTLADRLTAVTCPICAAGTYDAGLKVSVGNGQSFTCGYLQETVQDVNMNSAYESERLGCRTAQLKAEEGGCCSQLSFINLPGADLHDSCSLCGSGRLVDRIEPVDTGVMGSHTCSSINLMMQEKMLSPNLCPQIIGATASKCCIAVSGRSAPMLRGAAMGTGLETP